MSNTPIFDNLPQVNKHDHLPRHVQVQHTLRDLITSGKLRTGDKIPAELDIAAALGVSKMTVNKALLALTADGFFIREVGRGTFVAPSSAKHLSEKAASEKAPSSKTLPPRIILSFVDGARNILDSVYYGTLYRGIIDYLTTQEKSKALEVSLSSLKTENTKGEQAIGRLIIAPRIESLPAIIQLWNQGQSLVVIGASWTNLPVPTIDSDNIAGAMMAMQHLIDLKHERIALLYSEEETANIQDRITGYRRALTQAQLPYDPACEIRAARSWDIGTETKREIARLLTGENPVTAIFAVGHNLALEAKNAVREAGKQIPEDVSVVGYDDPVAAKLVYPPLTTIRQPLHEMGRRGAERLMRLIRGEEGRTPVHEILPPELIIRQSSRARE